MDGSWPINNDHRRGSMPLPASTTDTKLAQALDGLSINAAAATALPSSPQAPSPLRLSQQHREFSSSLNSLPPRSPLNRSASSMSLDRRSSTPTSLLRKKSSMNSLNGNGAPGSPTARSSPSRQSSHHASGPNSLPKSPLSEVESEPAPPSHTAESVASNHFKSELEMLHRGDRCSNTIVVLHDACYGHRYSRPRTSKASLSTIVERPERILASVLGVSMAYIRLGGRHLAGQYPLHPHHPASEIPDIPFNIRKTTRRLNLSCQAVTNVHGTKWMEELNIMCNSAESRLAMNGKELVRPEMNRGPDQPPPAKFHEGDLYLCSESLNAMEGALGAVCEGVDAVFQGSKNGTGPHKAFVAIRPPGHHCSASYPSGFCWLNNVHVGISHAALTHGLTHAAIVDFDLHHGDGSQAIAWEQNTRRMNLPKNALAWKKTSVGYFSLHDINSYPCEMGDEEKVKNASLCIENAHGQSIWNVHLQPWKQENEFWEHYENKYMVLLEKTRNYLRSETNRLKSYPNGPKPKAAIFLSAGFDASEWEGSGMQRHKVNVPTEFYARFTKDVVKIAAEEETSVEGRVVSVLEGGYSDRALCSGVFSHLSGLTSGETVAIKQEETKPTGLGIEMGQKFGIDDMEDGSLKSPAQLREYDPSWWSMQRLDELDLVMNPLPDAPEPLKKRDMAPPTYSTPTQSFMAKVSSPRIQRHASNGSLRPVSRAPTPPPPEVEWTVAAHELSKILIPSDRQTKSCKPGDLSAEATRARRDRQSILVGPVAAPAVPIPAPENPSGRMALRTRKPAKPTMEPPPKLVAVPASKANRRKTVAGAAMSSDKPSARTSVPKAEPGYAKPTKQSARRLSLASNTGSITSEVAPILSMGDATATSTGAARPRSTSGAGSASMSSNPPPTDSNGPPLPNITSPGLPLEKSQDPFIERTLEPQVDVKNSDSFDPTPSNKPAATPETANADMDNLAAGMTKMRLNLTTKYQRELKEKGKSEGKQAPAKPARVASAKTAKTRDVSATKLPKARVPSRTNVPIAPAPTPMPAPQTQPPVENVPQNTPQSVEQTPARAADRIIEPLPHSSPPTSNGPQESLSTATSISTTSSQSENHASTSSLAFIPYNPEGPAPNAFVPQEPLTWLAPNTSTPQQPLKRAELPMFSATSAIPFGIKLPPAHAPDLNDENTDEPLKPGASIWDIPDSPVKK